MRSCIEGVLKKPRAGLILLLLVHSIFKCSLYHCRYFLKRLLLLHFHQGMNQRFRHNRSPFPMRIPSCQEPYSVGGEYMESRVVCQ